MTHFKCKARLCVQLLTVVQFCDQVICERRCLTTQSEVQARTYLQGAGEGMKIV